MSTAIPQLWEETLPPSENRAIRGAKQPPSYWKSAVWIRAPSFLAVTSSMAARRSGRIALLHWTGPSWVIVAGLIQLLIQAESGTNAPASALLSENSPNR